MGWCIQHGLQVLKLHFATRRQNANRKHYLQAVKEFLKTAVSVPQWFQTRYKSMLKLLCSQHMPLLAEAAVRTSHQLHSTSLTLLPESCPPSQALCSLRKLKAFTCLPSRATISNRCVASSMP
eukprot:GHRR01022916.1.p1 GENE.GHRR01022916.1~~GHRR01022916.1.p1  ORF type:complete len:123 (-),score=25.67 GHRR01022916.1:678-1046(-)